MRTKLFRAGVLVSMIGAMTLWVAAPVAANGVSQIVLSCTVPPLESSTPNGCHSSELAPPPAETPPIIIGSTFFIVAGFWVWCQNPNVGTPYGPDCHGSMYVEEVDLVSGTGKYQATSVSGSSASGGVTGLQVSFTSSDGDMSCLLSVPTSPTAGGTNTLAGLCDGVPITFSHAVVQVTGG